MRIPRVQKDITDVATRELTQRLGVPVRIQHVDLKWLNKVVLDGVYLEDQKGKTLFEANHITAGLDLWPLLQGRLVFTTARIFGFTFNLEKETDHSPLNLQFVIDAFARRDTVKRASDIELRFNTILIRRGNFNFNVADAPNRAPKFDAKHTAVEDINATISIRTHQREHTPPQPEREIRDPAGQTLARNHRQSGWCRDQPIEREITQNELPHPKSPDRLEASDQHG